MRKYIAELIGTFALTTVVLLSLSSTNFPVPTPVLAALTLMLFVYSIGVISGTNINPAITAGLLAIGRIDVKDAFFYILAQFIGAGAAIMFIRRLGVQLPVAASGIDANVFFAEAAGAFFFAFGVASVALDKVPNTVNGIMVGGSLLLGIAIAALIGSNGILNPAVAFGAQSFSLPYIAGPVLGAVLGMVVYKLLSPKEQKKSK